MEKNTYLQQLKFDPQLLRSFVAKYLGNPRLVLLLLTTIIGVGLYSYFNLPRRLNPEVKIPYVFISTVLPGASPQDIEALVTEPLENEVTGLNDVKEVTSSSRENVSVIQVEFNSGIDPEEARVDVQSAVDQAELPEDAQTPRVQAIDFENQPVWSFALTASGDTPSLSRFAHILKDELEEINTIENAATSGLEESEIRIEVDPSKVVNYNLNPIQLQQAIKSATGSFPAGSIRSEESIFALTIDPAVTDIQGLRELKINLNGSIVPLGEIASITEQGKPGLSESFFAAGDIAPERTIRFDIFKTDTANIDKAQRDAEAKIDELLEANPQFKIQTITNAAELIDEQFSHLLRDFAITVILVFVVLFLFLGLRQAVVSFIAVPITFLISFGVMKATGISLNFLSMFSLLLSLGLLVDDTIVVISAMTSYYRSGKFTPLQTGLLVWRDFFIPILTTTLTTVWAFLPLLLSTGIIGEFIKSIPIVVSSTLLASFFVAMLITLPLMIILLKPDLPNRVKIFLRILLFVSLLAIFLLIAPKGPILILEILALIIFLGVTASVRLAMVRKSKVYIERKRKESRVVREVPRYVDSGIISFHSIGMRYKRALKGILLSPAARKRTIIMVVIFSLFSYLLVPLGFVKNEFFPKSDNDYIYATLELPAGTNAASSKDEALRILDELRLNPAIDYIIADVGSGFSSETGGTSQTESNNVLFSIVLPEERDQSSIDTAQMLRTRYATYSKGKFTIQEVSGGPPAGADIQIKLFGQDLATLQQYATKVENYLQEQEGIASTDRSIKPGTGKLVFVPDTAKLASNNIGVEQLGLFLRTFASGFTLDSVKFANNGGEDKDVSLRFGGQPEYVENLQSLSLPTPVGAIPLSSLGSVELKPNPTLITREGGKRTISITAGIEPGYTPTELNTKLEQFANSGLALPEGYTWKTGGVNEENQNSVNSILTAMLLSFLLIIVTMVIQFSSLRKALIVMLVIPLSISGVFILFALTNTPLSFPALIGVLALFGIVVKNSILIVDKIHANEKAGIEFTESIADASESRLEAIALTSVATIMGLIPITLSDPLWRGLGGAIIAGLALSGTIMLFFIPVVYYYWFKPNTTRRRPSHATPRRTTAKR
jgi:multidrug efflux pump subunit AcrB